MKKFLAILLCLVMVLGCLVGCAKTETKQEEAPKQEETKKEEPKKEEPKKEETKKEDTTQQTETKDETPAWVPGQLPLVQPGEDNVITIGLNQHAMIEDYETNATTLWIEEQTGVDLQFVYFSATASEAQTQLNAMVAANEKLPDILSYLALPSSLMYQLGEDGYFLDLTDYINDLGYYFWENYNQLTKTEQENIWLYGTDPNNGAFYGYPSYAPGTGVDTCGACVLVNQKWLDKVGKEVPTTLAELRDVLQAFKDGGDMNGDGIENDIGGLGYYTGNKGDITEFIINAFIYCNDKGGRLNVTDGQLWAPFVTDEYREALKYMFDLYKDGLLNPLTFSIAKAAEIKALTTPAEGPSLVGLVTCHPTNAFDVAAATAGNVSDYVAVPPMKDETGKGGYGPRAWVYPTYDSYVTADAKNPELAFKLMDFIGSVECVHRMYYGEYGVDWDYAAAGTVDNYGDPAAIHVINNVWRTQNNKCWNMVHTSIRPAGCNASEFVDDGSPTSARSALNRDCRNYYNAAGEPAQLMGTLIYTAEEKEEVTELSTGIGDYIDEARALFVSGVMDPYNDADWQTYLDNLNTLHLDRFISIAQAAWTRMHS